MEFLSWNLTPVFIGKTLKRMQKFDEIRDFSFAAVRPVGDSGYSVLLFGTQFESACEIRVLLLFQYCFVGNAL